MERDRSRLVSDSVVCGGTLPFSVSLPVAASWGARRGDLARAALDPGEDGRAAREPPAGAGPGRPPVPPAALSPSSPPSLRLPAHGVSLASDLSERIYIFLFMSESP